MFLTQVSQVSLIVNAPGVPTHSLSKTTISPHLRLTVHWRLWYLGPCRHVQTDEMLKQKTVVSQFVHTPDFSRNRRTPHIKLPLRGMLSDVILMLRLYSRGLHPASKCFFHSNLIQASQLLSKGCGWLTRCSIGNQVQM